LASALLAHPLLALLKRIANAGNRAGATGPPVSRRGAGVAALAAWSARLLPISGGLLLLFLAVHLGQLRWVRPLQGQELATLLAVLASPWSLLLYVAAGLALALHLFHGHESAHRSLGLLDGANGGRIRTSGRGLALALGVGFALLPLLLVLLGPARAGAGG
jgi:succinate dehydrogenase / fumarate reductase cytochrome b subunit